MDMAIKNNLKKQEWTVEEMVPKEYHEFLNVFSEEKAARFPESKEWNHKIDMKEGFKPKSFNNYTVAHKTIPMFGCFEQMDLVWSDDIIQGFGTHVQQTTLS